MDYLGAYQNQKHRGRSFDELLTLASVRRPTTSAPVYQRSRRLPPDEITALVDAYEAGTSVYTLADIHGINRRTVADLLRSNGVTLRYRRLTEAQLTEAEDLRNEGWSYVRLGERFSVDQSTVWSALRRRSTPPARHLQK